VIYVRCGTRLAHSLQERTHGYLFVSKSCPRAETEWKFRLLGVTFFLMQRIDFGFCWCFPNLKPTEDLKRLRDCGFDGIELWPDPINSLGASTWAAALKATGMRALQLCPYFNFMGGETTIARSREMLTKFLADAKTLDCSRLRVFTGPPWGEGVVGAHQATAQQWEDSIRSLREFCDIAAAQNVELCLECHEGSLMEDSPSALRLLHGVNRPNLTTNLQIPFVNEHWKVSVESLGPTTTHIHIHNWTQDLGKGDLTFLGEGAFDWEPVVRALSRNGRESLTLSVEHADHGQRHDPWETARRDGIYLNALRSKVAKTSA
jgi:sugar phosphate isomerase/epimerase